VGYFGNESSEVDLSTFAALHIEIPKSGVAVATSGNELTARGKRP
jgi:hypothetical protein